VEEGLTGSTGFAVLRPKEPRFSEIIYLASTSKENIDRLSHLADGGAYPAVRPELVLATEFIAGLNDRLITEFCASAKVLIDRAEANKREIRTLTETRDFLLPKLMSGEVSVRDAGREAK
jgi:type I restriction enzyme S subunit